MEFDDVSKRQPSAKDRRPESVIRGREWLCHSCKHGFMQTQREEPGKGAKVMAYALGMGETPYAVEDDEKAKDHHSCLCMHPTVVANQATEFPSKSLRITTRVVACDGFEAEGVAPEDPRP